MGQTCFVRPLDTGIERSSPIAQHAFLLSVFLFLEISFGKDFGFPFSLSPLPACSKTKPIRLLELATKESVIGEKGRLWFSILVIPVKLGIAFTRCSASTRKRGSGIYLLRHSRHP